MIRASAGAAGSGGEAVRDVAARAVERALARAELTAPDALWIALSGAWSSASPTADLLEAALEGAERLLPGCAAVAVVTRGAGLLSAEGEWRQREAVGVLLVEGADLRAFAVEDLERREDCAGPEAAAQLDHDLQPEDAIVAWADALASEPTALLASLSSALAPASIAGVGLSGPGSGAPVVLAGGRAVRRGVAGWRWRGQARPVVRAASACRALTGPLEVTRARGHWLLGLGGRPALDVFRVSAGGPLFRDPARAARVVKVAVIDGEDADPEAGPRALANVVGFDGGRGAISVAPAIRSGQRVALVQLDPETARLELASAAAALAGARPPCAMCFSCRGRGVTPFELEGVESGLIETGLGGSTAWLGIAGDHPFAATRHLGERPTPGALTFHSVLLALA